MTTINEAGNPSMRPPIGLLLRRLDALIDERFGRTLGARGITRRQWQLLRTLAGRPMTLDDLSAAVAPFLDEAAGETARQHLEPLVRLGAVTVSGDACALSQSGRALVDELAQEVQATRDLTVRGLADGEYDRTLTSLQRMIANLSDPA